MENITKSKRTSIHLHDVREVTEPTQGAWKMWSKEVVVISTEVGFLKRKGMHNH